VESDLNLLS